jgi:uncharacterized SAM-binding protein YcdF (DUF218 family)
MTELISASDNAVATPDRSRWQQQRPLWKRIVLAVAVILVGYYLVTLVQVVNAGRGDDARNVDAIVVLGAAQYDGRPSPQLAARLDHALLLWDDGIANYVVVTGGKIPGDRFTEAESSMRYLVERGVSEDAVLLENGGRTTFESLEAASELLAARGLADVVLVTDPFHAHRSRLTADEVGLTAYGSPTDTSVVTGWTSARRHMVEAAGVAVGRIIGFDRLSGL